MRFEQSNSQRLLFFGQNDHATIHVTGSSHKLALQTGGPGVEFQDAAGNHHLTVLETGTNGARIHGPALVQLKSDADSVYITAAEHNYFDVGAGATYSHIWRDDTNGETMRLKNGQLGIGTTGPAEKLDVAGNIRAEASSKSIVIDPYFVVSGDNQYSMISGSAGLAFYPNDSYTDFWVHSASRSVRFRAVASDGSFDAGSFLEVFPSSVGATGDAVANIRASSGDLTLL
jgi:hypothetical protein